VLTILFEKYVTKAQLWSALEASGLAPLLFAFDPQQDDEWPTLRTMITSGKRLVMFNDRVSQPRNESGDHYMWKYVIESPYHLEEVEEVNMGADTMGGTDPDTCFRASTYLTCQTAGAQRHIVSEGPCSDDPACEGGCHKYLASRGQPSGQYMPGTGMAFPKNKLYVLNHFLTKPVASPVFADIINTQKLMVGRASRCGEVMNHTINFLTVDYWSIGETYETVNQLNRLQLR
jgi:hypothetical protein